MTTSVFEGDRMFDDPSYDEFVEACAKHCICCRECRSDIPCAGTMAGGLCDHMCTCPLFDPEDDEPCDDEDDY